jgi:hypothetical protein
MPPATFPNERALHIPTGATTISVRRATELAYFHASTVGNFVSYYIRTPQIGQAQIWKIEDATAIRIGVSNPEHGAGTYFKAENGETIADAIRRQASGWFEPEGHNPFHKTDLDPGQFYPRMARPLDTRFWDSPGFYPGTLQARDQIATAQGQLIALAQQLERICQAVHPAARNMTAFGHEIRNVLILACTEVEAHWGAILK